MTPANGKFEGDILLTPEEEKAINDADKNIPQLRSDDDNSNDVSQDNLFERHENLNSNHLDTSMHS